MLVKLEHSLSLLSSDTPSKSTRGNDVFLKSNIVEKEEINKIESGKNKLEQQLKYITLFIASCPKIESQIHICNEIDEKFINGAIGPALLYPDDLLASAATNLLRFVISIFNSSNFQSLTYLPGNWKDLNFNLSKVNSQQSYSRGMIVASLFSFLVGVCSLLFTFFLIH